MPKQANTKKRARPALKAFIIFAAATLTAHQAHAASAENGYVEVSSGTPGVVGIIARDNDFDITTKDVEDDFTAHVSLGTTAPWVFPADVPTEIEIGAGGSAGYAVVNQNDPEMRASGNIVLFKVDVCIDGVEEENEIIEGAFVAHADCANGLDDKCIEMLKPVKIRCLPETQ